MQVDFSPAPGCGSDRLCCAFRGRKRLSSIGHRTCFRSACRIGAASSWERGSVGASFPDCMLHLDLTPYAWPFTRDSMTRYMSHPVWFHLHPFKPNDEPWALGVSPPIGNHNLPSTSWEFFLGKNHLPIPTQSTASLPELRANRWFHGAEIIV